jgi:hypothetical protein
MTTIDYDARRRTVEEVEEDSLNGLPAPRVSAQSPVVDLEQPDAVEGFELPGEELTAEEPTMSVAVPMRADEFRCSRCFLVYHRSQRLRGDRRIPCLALVPGDLAAPAPRRLGLDHGRVPPRLPTDPPGGLGASPSRRAGS